MSSFVCNKDVNDSFCAVSPHQTFLVLYLVELLPQLVDNADNFAVIPNTNTFDAILCVVGY